MDHKEQAAAKRDNERFTEAEIARARREDPGQAQCETESEARRRAIGWLQREAMTDIS